MQLGGYDIDILVQGYPGRPVCHSGLGWSTVVLIRGKGRRALVDMDDNRWGRMTRPSAAR